MKYFCFYCGICLYICISCVVFFMLCEFYVCCFEEYCVYIGKVILLIISIIVFSINFNLLVYLFVGCMCVLFNGIG